MSTGFTSAIAVPLPAQSRIYQVYPTVHLADAFAIDLPAGTTTDPDKLARFIFAHQPAWIRVLTRVRDLIVAGFGLKTTRELASLGAAANPERVGIFKVYGTTEHEIVVGEDDKHLDFRVSVLCSGPRLTLSTVVHCHNLLGRSYLFVIAPFHRMVVKASLRRAARIGWPGVSSTAN